MNREQDTLSELEARLASASLSPGDPLERALERVDVLNQLAWEVRLVDRPRAGAIASEARELAVEHSYILGQARAVRTLAMTITDAAAPTRLFSLAEEAKRLFDEANDGPGRAASRDFLASLHEHIGDYAGGLDFALDALSIARELGDLVRQGYALSSVGGILAASGEVDTAIVHLEDALQLFRKAEDSVGVGTICSRLCRVLKSAGRNEEALRYAKILRETTRSSQDWTLRLVALTVMAEVEDEDGNPEAAERLYRSALDSSTTELARNIVGTSTQIALGRLLIRQGALSDAELELKDALTRVEGETVSIVGETDAHEALAELYECQSEFEKAIQHLRKAQSLREQISQRDAHNKLAQLEARATMEAAKKDAEIHRLRFVELHGMQSKLVEAEKMALLGKLAAGTAHELNTPLGVLRNNFELSATASKRLAALVRDDGERSARAEKLASVLDSCRETSDEALERLAGIASSFRRFTQLDQAEFRTFDVREGLDSALALLLPTIPGEVDVERRFNAVPKIEGWPRELNHAFLTVLQNAVQAIDAAGVVSAETSATEEHVLVRVRDTGRGLSRAASAHLFDVSWSEEGTRTSMRLGLSAAYSTMQKHGGALEVESAVGQGTTMTFRFPIPTRSVRP